VNGKIALEEHFALPDTLGDSEQYAVAGSWGDLQHKLLDLGDRRLHEMDRHGIALSILSLNSPAIQAICDTRAAVETAQRANDALADAVARRPDRFAGFAALPMQDADAAALELTRGVRDLGFKGALVNGFSERRTPGAVVYYDDPVYAPFWSVVEQLGVPFYLHPRDPLPAREPIYDGHPWFRGSAWAFGAETAMHALRLMASGLFDRHPRLTMILGHLGEGLPYSVWRIDHRLRKSPRGIPARRTMSEYLRSNVYLTTSGNFRTPTLVDAIAEVGSDRIMFSVDYPFEETAEAASWFDAAAISEDERLKIGRDNAAALFRPTAAALVTRDL
jgi:predicted TIM-barrel fold metal-dependent hydrolase